MGPIGADCFGEDAGAGLKAALDIVLA